MRLLDLVEEQHGVRTPPHRLGELAAFLVAHVPGRRADEPGDRVPLLVLRHVEPDERPLVVEHELGERAGELGLADAGRPEKDEGADRAVRILEPGAGATEGVRHRLDRGILADDALMEALLHVHQLLDLTLEETRDRDAGPGGDHGGDVVFVDLLLHHRRLRSLLALGELLLELGQDPVPDLGHTSEVPEPLLAFRLHPQLVDLALDLPDSLQRLLLSGPASGELVAHGLGVRELALDRCPYVLGLVRHRRELDLELPHTAVRLVELHRRGVDLHAEPRGGLVDEVDGLVGQVAVGHVAIREEGGRDEGGVADLDTVVRLVAFLQAAEDRDRLGDRRLAHEDGLEASLERSVLLDVLAVLVERCRAHGAQLSPREHRLQEVGRVDSALGRAGSDDRVQLVDEEDDVARGVLDLAEHRLQALLELAAVLRSREQCPQVQCPHALASEALRNIACHDSLREPLDDRGLADPWLADQHRVVLRAPGEHLDHATDLFVAADDGVELPRLGERGQIAAVLLERLIRALRILRRNPLPGAYLLQRLEQPVARDDLERQEQMLDRDVLVAERLHLVERPVEHPREPGRCLRLGAPARDGRLLCEASLRLRAQLRHVVTGALGERTRQLLVEERERQVVRRQLRIPVSPGQLLCARERLLRLQREPVEIHVSSSGPGASRDGRGRARVCTTCARTRSRHGAPVRVAPCAHAGARAGPAAGGRARPRRGLARAPS